MLAMRKWLLAQLLKTSAPAQIRLGDPSNDYVSVEVTLNDDTRIVARSMTGNDVSSLEHLPDLTETTRPAKEILNSNLRIRVFKGTLFKRYDDLWSAFYPSPRKCYGFVSESNALLLLARQAFLEVVGDHWF